MHMSMWRLDRAHSVARNLLRDPELAAIAGITSLAAGIAAAFVGWVGAVAIVAAGIGIVAAGRRRWMASALSRSLAAGVALQRRALAEHAPDVVVGSSWGGAVASVLIAEGRWRGPTVLLAPAGALVHDRIDPARTAEHLAAVRDRPDRGEIVVFHDPADEVVPFDGSRTLAAGPRVRLRPVAGGGHRLLSVLEDGQLARTVRELAANAAGPS